MFRHTAYLLFATLLLVVVLMAGCGGGGGGGSPNPPTVSSTSPTDGAMDVAINAKITATFSQDMAPSTITTPGTFTLRHGTTSVSGEVTYAANRVAIFTPEDNLAPDTTFTATITHEATNLAGNALECDYVWRFTTGATSDDTAPYVISTSPPDLARDVDVNKKITATFNEEMDPSTIDETTFTLQQGGPVSGTVTYASGTATFSPDASLAPDTTYTATITTGVRDLAGIAMALPYVWSFTTAGTTGEAAPIDLRSAAPFLVLAGSTVTSTGFTVVNGDLGVSPGSAVDGFPPGIVTGIIHVSDPVADQAKLDLTTAYLDAAARSVNRVTVAGNLGGQTIYPGLYWSESSLAISSGDLTLDALGDANAVFIFQMGSTLTTTTGRQVILSGSADAANIYWQVGSSATLGTYSHFEGNILALESITLETGATLNGRALTQIGAVTLDASTINMP